jgi:hypothetical protein
MLAASVLNLVFAAALGLTRLDFFIRDALKWNTKDLYENPVAYLSVIAGAATFLVIFTASFATLLIGM